MSKKDSTATFTEKESLESARHDVYQILKTFKPAALATADLSGNPHIAIVYSMADEDLNVYFVTNTRGQKYENLLHRSAVAMTVMARERSVAVQLTGVASFITENEKEQKIIMDLWRKDFDTLSWPAPPIKLFEAGYSNELAVVKILPKKMTYINFDSTANAARGVYFEKVI